MGNAFSSVVTSQKKEDVNSVIADVMNCFLLRFLVHYKHRIISKYAAFTKSLPNFVPPPTELKTCPRISTPLKSGVISKQRVWIKSWSDRYFVIRNEADNYRIDYYRHYGGSSASTLPPPSALKGSIYPVGYYIESFLSDSEVKALDSYHHIKLSSLNPNKGPWYLKVNTLQCVGYCVHICVVYTVEIVWYIVYNGIVWCAV